jgi:hypothetical protein
MLVVKTSISSDITSCKRLLTSISNHNKSYFLVIFIAGTSTMRDVSDPTVHVILLSITRNQDLSEWDFDSSDQKSLCRNLIESGISVMDFALRHCSAIHRSPLPYPRSSLEFCTTTHIQHRPSQL